jgi:microcompartment protein CcmL/EutN
MAKDLPGEALGLVETRGLIGMIEAADAMVRPRTSSSSAGRKVDAGLVTAIVRGDVASVKAATMPAPPRPGASAAHWRSRHRASRRRPRQDLPHHVICDR